MKLTLRSSGSRTQSDLRHCSHCSRCIFLSFNFFFTYLNLNFNLEMCAINPFVRFTAYFEGRNFVGDGDWRRVGKNCQRVKTYGRFFFSFPVRCRRTFERTSTLDAITILSSLICEHFTRTLLLHGHCERRALHLLALSSLLQRFSRNPGWKRVDVNV